MTSSWRADDELMTNWWRADDELMANWWRADAKPHYRTLKPISGRMGWMGWMGWLSLVIGLPGAPLVLITWIDNLNWPINIKNLFLFKFSIMVPCNGQEESQYPNAPISLMWLSSASVWVEHHGLGFTSGSLKVEQPKCLMPLKMKGKTHCVPWAGPEVVLHLGTLGERRGGADEALLTRRQTKIAIRRHSKWPVISGSSKII